MNFFRVISQDNWVSSFQKPSFHITKMSNKVGFTGTYLTNSQCLAKDCWTFGVFWIRRCVMEKLMTVCRFNKLICRNFTIQQFDLTPRKVMHSLFASWVNLIKSFLCKSFKNNLSFFFTMSSNKKDIVCVPKPYQKLVYLWLKKFSFNFLHKYTSAWRRKIGANGSPQKVVV